MLHRRAAKTLMQSGSRRQRVQTKHASRFQEIENFDIGSAYAHRADGEWQARLRRQKNPISGFIKLCSITVTVGSPANRVLAFSSIVRKVDRKTLGWGRSLLSSASKRLQCLNQERFTVEARFPAVQPPLCAMRDVLRFRQVAQGMFCRSPKIDCIHNR